MLNWSNDKKNKLSNLDMGLSHSRLRTARTLKVGINHRYQLPLTPLFNVAHFGLACDEATQKEYKKTPSKLDKGGYPKRNIAVAEIGFIINSNNSEALVSLPVQIPEEDVYSIGKANQQLHTPHTPPHTPPRQTIQAFHMASQQNRTPGSRKSRSPDSITNASVYMQQFHHSEQALAKHLNDHKTVPHYLKQLSEKIKDFDPQNIIGTVLDLYSTRAVCHNCKHALIGLLSDNSTFMTQLYEKTKNKLIRGCRVVYKKPIKINSLLTSIVPKFNTSPLIFTHHINTLPKSRARTPQTSYTIFSSRGAEKTPQKIKKSVAAQLTLKGRTLFK